MASTIPLFFILFCLASTGYTKKISKCKLVHELRRHHCTEHQIKDLVCIVEAESSFQTRAKSGPNKDGSHNWGLFQISDRYWCNAGGSPGKGCNVRCKDLLSNNISASISCAKTILASQGMDAWSTWVNKCKGKHLPALGC